MLCMDPTHSHTDATVSPKELKENWRLLVNTLLAIIVPVVLLIGGFAINSLVVVANAGHQAIDGLFAISALLATFGISNKPNIEYNAGKKRQDFLTSSTANTVLITFEAFAMWEAFSRLATHSQHADASWVYLLEGINLLANVFTSWLLRNGKSSVAQFLSLHNLGDASKSFFVIVAYIAMQHGVTSLYGLNIEGLTVIAVGSLICFASWKQKTQVDAILVGKSRVDLFAISHAIRDIPGIVNVRKLHSWTLDTDNNAISMSIGTSTISMKEKAEIEVQVKRLLDSHKILPMSVLIGFHLAESEDHAHLPLFLDSDSTDFTVTSYDVNEFHEDGIYKLETCGTHFHPKMLKQAIVSKLGEKTDIPKAGQIYKVHRHGKHCHFEEVVELQTA